MLTVEEQEEAWGWWPWDKLHTLGGCQAQVKKVADIFLLMVCFFSGVLLKKRVVVRHSDWGVWWVFKLLKMAVSIG